MTNLEIANIIFDDCEKHPSDPNYFMAAKYIRMYAESQKTIWLEVAARIYKRTTGHSFKIDGAVM